MTKDDVKEFYSRPGVVEEYARATNAVGLWESEEKIFRNVFKPDDTLLELGCGAGRIAVGLWELGYKNIMATDVSREMVKETRRINKVLEYGICSQVADATKLPFADEEYEGAIFGFNGLMQIPLRTNRQKALQEIYRVLQSKAYFVFTSHDRNSHGRKGYWKSEKKRWDAGKQDPLLNEFGDVTYQDDGDGLLFIHSPDQEEVISDCKNAGFRIETTFLRSQFCQESQRVLAFSDDCRLWLVQKP